MTFNKMPAVIGNLWLLVKALAPAYLRVQIRCNPLASEVVMIVQQGGDGLRLIIDWSCLVR